MERGFEGDLKYKISQINAVAIISPISVGKMNIYSQRMVASKKLELVLPEKLLRMVNMDTLRHSNVREVDAENKAY